MSTFENEVTSSVAPARLFKALCLEASTLVPQIMPQAIKSVEVLEGDGGPGTIRKTNFADGMEYKCMKSRIEAVDLENLKYSYSVIGGDVLPDIIEKISYDLEFLPAPDGGSICKTKGRYHYRGDAQLPEDRIKEGQEKAKGMFRAIEAHLVQNPDVCA